VSRVKRRRTNDSDNSSVHSGQGGPRDVVWTLSHLERSQSSGELSPPRDEDAFETLLKAADISHHESNQITDLLPPASHIAEQDTNAALDLTGQESREPEQSFSPQIQPDTPGVWPHASVQEACLMRYFIDELACWVS
jgi:hypothetical protein